MKPPICVIIGAGDGLGRSLAGTFAEAGHSTALISRSEAGSAAALMAARVAAPALTTRFFAADAMEPESIDSAVTAVQAEMGEIDILIYNARGEPAWKPPLDMSYGELREIFELEVVGAFAAARAVLPAMLARGRGSLLFSSATAAFRGSASNPLFAIGKFGLRALAQSLAKAYARQGIHAAHLRLDCTLDTPQTRREMGASFNAEDTANTDDVARTYLWVHQQPKSAWSNEVELRPYTELWTI